MKKIFVCQQCNNEFAYRSDSKNLFCSHSCSQIYTGLTGQIRNEISKNLNIEIYNLQPTICKECGNGIDYKKRNNKFCSRSCSATFTNKKRLQNGYTLKKSTRTNIANTIHTKNKSVYDKNPKKCLICNTTITYEKRLRKTCSNTCTRIHNKISGQKGGLMSSSVRPKRSKNEIAMYELCSKYFNKVTHNEPIFDGWDADILIYDYKIAILWNGDWHYKEMNCYNHSLKQVQNRDKHKSKLIAENGWIEYIVKDTTEQPIKPVEAFSNLLNFLKTIYH